MSGKGLNETEMKRRDQCQLGRRLLDWVQGPEGKLRLKVLATFLTSMTHFETKETSY